MSNRSRHNGPPGTRQGGRHTAVRREAGQHISARIAWGGRTWSVEVDKDNLSVELLEAFEDGKTATGLRELLGPVQWAQFKAMQPGAKGLNEMYTLLADELGFTSLGESSASPA